MILVYPMRLMQHKIFVVYKFVIEFMGVTLLNKIMWVSGVQVYNTSSVCGIVGSPPHVQSPSLTIHPPYPLPPPRPVVTGWCRGL